MKTIQNLNDYRNKFISFLESNNIKETTLSTYTRVFDSILKDIGEKLPSDLNLQFLKNYINNKCKVLSEKYICNFVTVINQFIDFLYKEKTIENSFGVKAPYFFRKDVVSLTKEEQKNLCTYLNQNLTQKNIGILIALYTGVRIGELCAIKVRDINLKEGYLSITKTIQRIKNLDKNVKSKTIVVEVTPKSKKSVRQIPLKNELIEILKPILELMNRDDYIITNKNKFTEPRTIEEHYNKILKKCNIQHYKFHVLRHTFANNCLIAGIDIKVLSVLLGHASVTTTYDLYLNPTQEFKRSQLEKIPFL